MKILLVILATAIYAEAFWFQDKNPAPGSERPKHGSSGVHSIGTKTNRQGRKNGDSGHRKVDTVEGRHASQGINEVREDEDVGIEDEMSAKRRQSLEKIHSTEPADPRKSSPKSIPWIVERYNDEEPDSVKTHEERPYVNTRDYGNTRFGTEKQPPYVNIPARPDRHGISEVSKEEDVSTRDVFDLNSGLSPPSRRNSFSGSSSPKAASSLRRSNSFSAGNEKSAKRRQSLTTIHSTEPADPRRSSPKFIPVERFKEEEPLYVNTQEEPLYVNTQEEPLYVNTRDYGNTGFGTEKQPPYVNIPDRPDGIIEVSEEEDVSTRDVFDRNSDLSRISRRNTFSGFSSRKPAPPFKSLPRQNGFPAGNARNIKGRRGAKRFSEKQALEIRRNLERRKQDRESVSRPPTPSLSRRGSFSSGIGSFRRDRAPAKCRRRRAVDGSCSTEDSAAEIFAIGNDLERKIYISAAIRKTGWVDLLVKCPKNGHVFFRESVFVQRTTQPQHLPVMRPSGKFYGQKYLIEIQQPTGGMLASRVYIPSKTLSASLSTSINLNRPILNGVINFSGNLNVRADINLYEIGEHTDKLIKKLTFFPADEPNPFVLNGRFPKLRRGRAYRLTVDSYTSGRLQTKDINLFA